MIPLQTETALLLSLVYFLNCNLVDFIVANYDSITKQKMLHIVFYFIDCNLVGNCSLSSICGSHRLLRPIAGNQPFLLLHSSLFSVAPLRYPLVLFLCILWSWWVEFGSSWVRYGSWLADLVIFNELSLSTWVLYGFWSEFLSCWLMVERRS